MQCNGRKVVKMFGENRPKCVVVIANFALLLQKNFAEQKKKFNCIKKFILSLIKCVMKKIKKEKKSQSSLHICYVYKSLIKISLKKDKIYLISSIINILPEMIHRTLKERCGIFSVYHNFKSICFIPKYRRLLDHRWQFA